jgi:hypothetical protein
VSRTFRTLAAAGVAVVALSAASAPIRIAPDLFPQSETVSLSGARIGIWNLAGQVSLVPADGGSAVTVQITRHGADAARLKVAQGMIGETQTLRIIYPGDRIIFRPGWNQGGDWSTELRVWEDGTFGGEGRSDGGERVRISSSGSGLEASADLRVSVPKGQRITIELAAGDIVAENVNGQVSLDTDDGDITATRMTGRLDLDTGSGTVKVNGSDGDLSIDTGSGDVTASDLRGSDLTIDTGSGSVTVEGASADALSVDTGSGDVSGTGLAVRDLKVDTGSGGVELDYTTPPSNVDIDTGSGDVRISSPAGLSARVDLETSSGDIRTEFPVTMTSREHDELHGTIGDGQGRLHVETGSGDIILKKK